MQISPVWGKKLHVNGEGNKKAVAVLEEPMLWEDPVKAITILLHQSKGLMWGTALCSEKSTLFSGHMSLLEGWDIWDALLTSGKSQGTTHPYSPQRRSKAGQSLNNFWNSFCLDPPLASTSEWKQRTVRNKFSTCSVIISAINCLKLLDDILLYTEEQALWHEWILSISVKTG